EFAVLGGEAGGDALDGRVLPEDVVERFADAAPAALEVHLEVVVDEHQAEGVADPVGGAAVGGDHQGDHVPDGVLVGVGGGVGQQAGGEVVAGAGAFAGDEPDHRLGGAAFGGDGLLAAVHDEEDVGDEGGGVRLRQAELAGDDLAGDALGVLRDQVGRAVAAEGVHGPVGDLLAEVGELDAVDAVQRVADGSGAP